MTDQEAFLAAIAAAPLDDLPRLVFADWLDENGQPVEAIRQRKWGDSYRWMVGLADRLGADADFLVEAGTEWAARARPVEIEDDVYEYNKVFESVRALYWDHWSILTGSPTAKIQTANGPYFVSPPDYSSDYGFDDEGNCAC